MKAAPITIVGAGLVGSLLATLLAQRGFEITVFERRPDPRKAGFLGGRSINLALAERGWHGLRLAGLQDRMRPITVMMRGRMIHDIDGRTNLQRYGRDDSEVIWSVNRGTLNTTMLDAAEAAGAVIHFDQRLESVDWKTSTLHLCSEDESRRSHQADIILGSDGAGSALRASMAQVIGLGERFDSLGHSYKELEIPALADIPSSRLPADLREAQARGERFAMEPNALHIWPRGNYMCIALPNSEGSFTVTLFLPNEGEPSLASVSSAADARAFFERDFADTVPLIPDLEKDYLGNPTGLLGTLYLDRWHFEGKALLIGDASHAIVPFHGQGMNSGFEDAVELAELLTASPNDSAAVFAEFERRRKPNADAIAEMALDNYIEMRDRVDDADYLLMRELGHTLAARHPGRWVPRYWMVTFSRIPYAIAYQRGEIQQRILRELIAGKTSLAEINLDGADSRIVEVLGPVPTQES
ncbi:MAG TPA: NAD(P)/FAD-dependent oxidoreductase [Dokdonella sp.]|uniref:FAD-dependent oxidoreductase n=1 Tax=Dokdonella sp. TaxID=2291710 RepID=UPI002D7E3034|nr:NAD(P)/FAD-dependent oxidoreductase [Dokdonella sp.]HET9034092.1 NAD(P)/FAD-dependent oxidoreductase [Dokdonella sp.]